MRLHQNAIAGCEALGILMRPELVQESHGRDCTSEVMVFEDHSLRRQVIGFVDDFVHRPLSQVDSGLYKISGVTDLFVE
jgi:hypothetical protein